MNGSGDFFHHAFLLIGEEVLLVYAADRILQLANLLIAGFAFSDEFLLGDRAGYAQVDQLRALILDSLNLLFELFNYANSWCLRKARIELTESKFAVIFFFL